MFSRKSKTQGVLHGFSRKSNEDEFSRKSNGGCKNNNNNNNMIRLVTARIESGRGRFSRKSNEDDQTGDGFSLESNGVEK